MTTRTRFEEWHMKEFGFIPFDSESHPQSEFYYRIYQVSEARLLAEMNSPEMLEVVAAKIWVAYGGVPFAKVDRRCRAQYMKYGEAAISAITTKLKGE